MVALWDALTSLSPTHLVMFAVALVVAFGFEFINGFHDTANAVTTVIYTRTLKPTPAVFFSGFCNFLGVLLGGTGIAFGIVNLLPVDLLIESSPSAALAMVLSLLLAGVIWNLGTWYVGLPVSSSHTLIGSILGVGIANSLLSGQHLEGVNWRKAGEVGLSLLISPMVGFLAAGFLLLLMRQVFRDPRLYEPPQGDDRPPNWVRRTLIATCGIVSFAHGSNDGQKGMGLILLVLIGFLPTFYALNRERDHAPEVRTAAAQIGKVLAAEGHPISTEAHQDFDTIARDLEGVTSFSEVPEAKQWSLRQAIYRVRRLAEAKSLPAEVRAALASERHLLTHAIEYVPTWVVVGVALALGVGTTIGYKRIVITVAEKIGKAHLTYAQGAAAELVAAVTILFANVAHLPVSTTHVLSSGIAGTMWANRSGIQEVTVKKILLAWGLTLPASVALAAVFYTLAQWLLV